MGDQNLPELILFGIFCLQTGISQNFTKDKSEKLPSFLSAIKFR